ncbi:MAG: UDP-N-acetylmuramoyl-L-alanyl-D-glutamate--2,6-diaminopimelate ligase [Methylophilus sp.]|nr:UDP-N-acetylmuramoyl-L-alanyl-D-glutamate--2,6-diaminopimelate ligase [Methylophilus sp.]
MTRYVIKAPISSITADSRMVQKGSLFIAYPGESVDGRKYIGDAIKKGAVAVIWDEEDFAWNEQWDVKNIAIANLKLQAGYIASQFYKKPTSQLWTIGVTGTNGKTSVTHWITQAFEYLNRKAAVVGTLGNGFLDKLESTQNTTPGSIELQRMLAGYVNEGADVVAMEVSSHGLDQGRLSGTQFDVAVLTNLTRDHLDYHKTMAAYQEAKRRLFAWGTLKASVINHDDAFGQELADELHLTQQHTITYGIHSGEVRATAVELHQDHFTMHVISPYGNADVRVNLIGEFNVYNVLAVLSTLLVSDVPFEMAIEAISHLKPVHGRMQMLGGHGKPLVVVDYAHTPDALEKVLKTLKVHAKSKLICVFGCGGDRDTGKRPEMAKVVSRYADAVVITTDNPRSENPQTIVDEIKAGMQIGCIEELDRAAAISIAIHAAKENDIVLIAGKGHEDYQEIAGVKHYFSDAHEAALALEGYQEVLV